MEFKFFARVSICLSENVFKENNYVAFFMVRG